MRRLLVPGWSVAVGSMDLLTGVLLVAAPAWTLERMGVPPPGAEALPFLSWIGVFVGMVGASYLLAMWRGSGIGPAPVWRLTAWIRAAVAAFVAGSIAAGRLDPAWWPVAATDAVVAAVQWYGLRSRWLGGEGR